MKIVFMGTPEFAVPILEVLYQKYDVVLVISQPNRVKKKNSILDTPVAKSAKEWNLKVIQPERIRDCIDEILALQADILITAAYGQYVPERLLKGFRYALNVHGSLLPKYRGGAPIQRALMNGEKTTGVSIMQMEKRLDAGKVYAQAEYEILPGDTASDLFVRLSLLGRDLLMNVLEDIYFGRNVGVEQKEEEATYAPTIQREEEKLSLDQPTDLILSKIRGLAYEPGAYLMVCGVPLKVFKAEKVEMDSTEPAGTVLQVKKQIVIRTKDSAIRLTEVLYPGKKIVSGKDFANGQKIFEVGMVLNS